MLADGENKWQEICIQDIAINAENTLLLGMDTMKGILKMGVSIGRSNV